MATRRRLAKPKYPIYVISKGRHDRCLTARFLVRDGVPFHIVVEPQELDLYADEFGAERILVLPFSNLGLGGIPARNWVWERAKSAGHERHWILDDNIYSVGKRVLIDGKIKRRPTPSMPAFVACEDFADRYENVAMLGMAYQMFAPDSKKLAAFRVNHHVYSCILIKNDLPYRWRGRYNEDADLCLQVLSGGQCIVQVNAFLIQKVKTMVMTGGNSDQLYQGDGRLKMARSLERMWPHIVEVKRRFGRPQHVVRWGLFRQKLIPKTPAP